MTKLAALVSLCILFIACKPNLTPTQNLANIAGQIEQTTDQMVLAAKSLNQTNPTIMTDSRLIAVAMAGDKIGRAGADLADALMAYSNLKASNGDTTVQAAQINNLINSITQGFADLGKQIPNGTVSAIDQAAAKVLGFIAQIKVGVGL